MIAGFSSTAQAQKCFRGVLLALSRPGTLVTLEAPPPPAGLSPAAATILLTLADAATGITLPDAAHDWLKFHTGALPVARQAADFAVAGPHLSSLRNGTDEAPETGATLIIDVVEFAGPKYRLTGPGIETHLDICLPLDATFLTEWRAQRRIAPRGVDVLLCAGDKIIGLPRTTNIEEF
jgi:alpha-D-ribose 1-methylphosphonate 5-triphosphate synthase subunit PhnH